MNNRKRELFRAEFCDKRDKEIIMRLKQAELRVP